MRLQTQKPGEHFCILYCAAMLLEINVETIINMIGTDGVESWWPDYDIPKCYRGIHIQEIQDVFIAYGKCLYPIEKFPTLAPIQDSRFEKSIYTPERAETRFFSRLVGHRGILIYYSHAKALDSDGQIYDPNGKISEITVRESQRCHEAWLVGTL